MMQRPSQEKKNELAFRVSSQHRTDVLSIIERMSNKIVTIPSCYSSSTLQKVEIYQQMP